MKTAILEYHEKHPDLSLFQLKRQLKHLEGRRVSVKAIMRVLNDEKVRQRAGREVEVCDVAG